MGNAPFLATVLPALEFDSSPQISFEELITLLESNLSETDMKQVNQLRYWYDLKAILQFFSKERLSGFGNLTKQGMEEALSEHSFFSDEVFEYLQKFDSPKEKRVHFYELLVNYFHERLNGPSHFLKTLIAFERKVTLALFAYRCKKKGLDLLELLQFEDMADSFILELLSMKDHKENIFPYELKDLEQAVMQAGEDPLAQYLAVNRYRFNQFESLSYEKPFSIDYLLAYTYMLIILEEKHRLNKQQGQDIINGLLRDIS